MAEAARAVARCLSLSLAGVLGVAGCVSDRYPEGVARGSRATVAALGDYIHLADTLHAYYRLDGAGAITAVIVPSGATAAAADYASLTVVRLLWRPQPGATPLVRTATNAVVRHLVFAGEAHAPGEGQGLDPSGESLGFFTGAGFVKFNGDLADGAVELALREADLRLTDCSAGYTHPLRRAVLTGRVRATRNEAAVSRWLKAAGVRASAALGYPAWVRGPVAAPGEQFALHD